jgi:hypothetical protein
MVEKSGTNILVLSQSHQYVRENWGGKTVIDEKNGEKI